MKKIFLVAAVFIFGSAAYAQTSSTDTRTKFGIKAGVNLPKYKYVNDDANTSDKSESSANFHVTGYADIPVSSFFSVQPGISLQGKGAKLYGSDNLRVTEDVLAIEIPVNLLANIPAGPGHFFLGAGPYVGFNVAGQIKTKGSGTFLGQQYTVDTEEDLEIGDGDGDNIKALDFGVNLLGGYQFSSGFNIGAGYGLGFTNLYPGSTSQTNVEKNNRVLSFSVGYAF